MTRTPLASIFLLAAFLSIATTGLAQDPGPAAAVLELDNGDRISGTLVQIADGTWIVETAWGGELSIDGAAVVTVETETPVIVELGEDDTVTGTLVTGPDGVEIRGEGEPVVLTIAELVSVNPPPSVRRKLVIGAGANVQRGNTETTTLSASLAGSRRTDDDRFTYSARWNQAEESSVTTSESAFAAFKYDWFFRPTWYAYGGVEATRDEFKDLDLRILASVGLGWQAYESDTFHLALEAGLAHLTENRIDSEDTDELTSRLGIRTGWQLFDNVDLSDWLLVYPSFESDGGTQLRNELSLTTAVGFGLALDLTYVYEWDEDPPPGVEESDQLFVLGLQYQIE